MKSEKYLKYFDNFSCIYKNEAEYNLYLKDCIIYLKKVSVKKKVKEENVNVFSSFLSNIGNKCLIGEIKKSAFKNILIEALSITSFRVKSPDRVKSPELNKDIINIKFQNDMIFCEIIDDISMVCIRELIENYNQEKIVEIGIDFNSINIALKILKEKKKDDLIKIYINDKFLMLLWSNELLALKCFEINKDINIIKGIIKETSFSKSVIIEFPNTENLKEKFVEINELKINSNIIKELKETNRNYIMQSSENNIYRIKDIDNFINIFVLYPLEGN